MEFNLVGPGEVRSGQAFTPFPGGVPGAIFAILLIHQDKAVTVERLIDLVWGDRPPKTAQKTVRTHVMILRKALPVEDPTQVVETRGSGYCVPAQAGTYDAARFTKLARHCSLVLKSGEPAEAAELADQTLDLWRGQPFEDIKPLELIRSEREILQGIWLTLVEDRFDAYLRLERHREVLPEMERLAGAEPLREHLQALLMRALDQNGQQKKALAVYDRTYQALDDELGQPPGDELRKAQDRILSRGGSSARVPGQREARRRFSPMP